ncbi:MAG: hypothetical protein IT371_20210 [Deltaproteobacteria bacterium]|nr:hypothetical protein [Deltaproteobacteria bacterium]
MGCLERRPARAGRRVVPCLVLGFAMVATSVEAPMAGPARAALPPRAAVGAHVVGPRVLVAGGRATLRALVHWSTAPEVSGALPGATAELALLDGAGPPRPLARAVTDSHGSAQLAFLLPNLSPGDRQLVLTVSHALGTDRHQATVRVIAGARVLLATDKPRYQPGQTVHLRALALRGQDLRALAGRPMELVVRDPKGNLVHRHRGPTSRFGVASTDFILADEVNLGDYRLEAVLDGLEESRATKAVRVERYVLPRFRVEVESERRAYRPGETVHGTVRARYFFGKPVTAARVKLDVFENRSGATVRQTVPLGPTDAEGRRPFRVILGSRLSGPSRASHEVRLVATVVDTAQQEEAGDLSLPVTDELLRVKLLPEGRALVRGVRNRVFVLAGYPDGQPAPRTSVELRVGGRRLLAMTDELGTATLEVTPPRPPGATTLAPRTLRLELAATDPRGEREQRTEELPVVDDGLLVRPAKSLLDPGEPAQVEVLDGLAPRRTLAHLDLVKDGQAIASTSAPLVAGRARLTLPIPPETSGLLELRAHVVGPKARRRSHTALLYAEAATELRVTARADRSVYRPGERARIHFQVVSSRTNEGTEAALGLLAVDDALVALGGLDRTDARLFFALSESARRGSAATSDRPGGRDLASWLADRSSADRRRRAVQLLLAAVSPERSSLWETDPWSERAVRWRAQAGRLTHAVRTLMEREPVGRETPKGWRFRADLVRRLVALGLADSSAALDPWTRPVRPWHLQQFDAHFTFARLADAQASRRLSALYEVLQDRWESLSLPRERVPRLARRFWPVRLPKELVSRLGQVGKLPSHTLLDPWGRRYEIRFDAQTFYNPYGSNLVSRYVIFSRGPDGLPNTPDDVLPPGPRRTDPRILRDPQSPRINLAAAPIVRQLLAGQAYGRMSAGSLGLYGVGAGGGGYGRAFGYGGLALAGAGGMPDRVRTNFPETLFWNPEIITDRQGRATVEVPLADSITTWRLFATASSADGLLGQTELPLRVYQDFFVELGLPTALTQGDRLSVPVTIYNYVKQRQRVTLRLRASAGISSLGPLEQTVELKPDEVAVRHFPVEARGLGSQDLTIEARGAAQHDAVRRSTRVEPDGQERVASRSGALTREVTQEVTLPSTAIAGTAQLRLTISPGPMSQTLEGMEGMLRMPHGCFEQTSSTLYPNLLVLDYLRQARKSSPTIERKAKEFISAGYQRLLSFEVRGGGFSWFGSAPANRILTAYGLMEFFDLARVHTVDPQVIARTQEWLVRQQRSDGSWGPDRQAIHEGVTNEYARDLLRITAYIANALQHSGYRGPALARALRYVTSRAEQAEDPYTLALLGTLLGPRGGGVAGRVLDRLWALRQENERGIYFEGPRSSLTYGAGKSALLEATALGATAFLAANRVNLQTGRLMDTLVASKDSFGSWHSTQATILSLKALLLQQRLQRARVKGSVEVLVDDTLRRRVTLDGEDTSHVVELSSHVRPGRQRVTLRFQGEGRALYQLVARHHVPRTDRAPAPAPGLQIATRLAQPRIQPGQTTTLEVNVANTSRRAVEMPLLAVALPPGVAVEEEDLTRLVRAGTVDKVQRQGNQALLYLSRLGPAERLRLTVRLRGQYPARVQTPPSAIYEYYRPEHRAETSPLTLQVL